MSPTIRKGGSIFILGTYVTGIALTVTYFVAGELLAYHDATKVVGSVQTSVTRIEGSIDTINTAMGQFIQFSNDNRKEIEKNTLKIDHNRELISNGDP